MKKGVLFSVVFVLILASIFSVFQITGYVTVSVSSLNGSVQKISDSVYTNIQANGSTDVLIKVSPGKKKVRVGFLTFSSGYFNKTEAENEVKADVKGKVSYSKDGLIYARINSSDLAKIENSNNVGSVTPERVFHVDSQDPTSQINVTAVQSIIYDGENLTGTGQTVCVIDTGIDYNNANFGSCYGDNNVSSGCKIIGGYNFINNSPYPLDDNGHGTHVAGIIAASGSLTGVAPGVKIVSIKVCDSSGSCSESNIQKGIDWCVNNASKFNITVISMSLGTPQLYSGYCNSDPLAPSINSAVAENISFVVASGNDGNTTAMSSPACVQNATSVGDTYVQDYSGTFSWGSPVVCSDTNPVQNQIVCHSNRDSALDLLAPGALINSTWLNSGYQLEGGTSMAAPHVSGAIAILKQYYALNNKILNSSQAEQALNYTGTPTYDSLSGLTFPRINVYSALFYLDKDSPVVSLDFPLNNSIIPESNQTFECNSTDLLLNNVTLKIWNSTGVYYNASENSGGQSNSSSFNVSMVYGKYFWNCFYGDSQNNTGFSYSNYTLMVSPGVIYLSPENNTYSNQNETFLCNSTYFASGVNLSNVTFDIFNSSALLHNETVNVSGSSNLTSFNYNFTKEGNYIWRCYFYSNDSNITFSDNYTFIYDLTSPRVNLSLPVNNTVLDGGTQAVSFAYNSTDNYALQKCSLELNGQNVSLDSNLTSGENNFSYSVSPGTYLWNVNCSDFAGNFNSSQSRVLTVNEVQSSPSSSSPSSPSVPVTSPGVSSYVQDNISQGYSVVLVPGAEKSFVLSGENHILSVNSISGPSANITVRSDPIHFVLYVGQDKYLNLSSPDYYDLYVKLNAISNGVANITIKELTSNNRIFHTLALPVSNNTIDTKNNGLNSGQIYLLFGILAVILVIAIIIVSLGSKGKKKNKRKSTRTKKRKVRKNSSKKRTKRRK